MKKTKDLLRPALSLTVLLLLSLIAEVNAFAESCVAQPAGLVSWWRAENNGNDSAGTNNATLVTTDFVAGRVGQAFHFGGDFSGNRISVADSDSLKLTNSMTIEGWIKIAQYTGFILFRGDMRSGLDPYALTTGPDGVSFHIESLTNLINLEAPVPLNEWRHVAATLNGESGDMKIYVNGVLAAQTNTTVRPFANLDPNFTPGFGIGSHGGADPGWLFNGLIDEISLYSRALSSNEILAIYNAGSSGKCAGTPPAIIQQPHDVITTVGSNATFTVVAEGTAPLHYQWKFKNESISGATNSSITLTNVQLGQAGNYSVSISNFVSGVLSSNATLTVTQPPSSTCVSAPSGLVSWWRAEGNGIDQNGLNNASEVSADFISGKVGQAFHFGGDIARKRVSIPDSESLKLTNSLTIEGWINIADYVGFILFRGDTRTQLDPYALTTSPNGVSFHIESLNQIINLEAPVAQNQWKHVAATLDGTTGDMKIYVDGDLVAQTNTTIRPFGNLDPNSSPALGIGGHGGALHGFYFDGSIDEISLYSRALSQSEIRSIYQAGADGKCETAVVPFIVQQPGNRSVQVGGTTSVSVQAGGTAPLKYQWAFNGTNILNATNSTLALTNVQSSQAGAYAVLVSNSIGSVLSSNAILSVTLPPATVRVVSGTAMAGTSIAVPIVLVANGNENALSFSLNFNANLLTYASVELGSDAQNASLLFNTSQTNFGRLGVALALNSGETFAQGERELARVIFTTRTTTSTFNTGAPVTFGDQPLLKQLSDVQAQTLPANYVNGIVTLTPTEFEADSAPRPNGNRGVSVTDWVQIGRFAAGLDAAAAGGEFQRADCAPKSTLGDGHIKVTDWVQAGRYAAGIDPLSAVGGPTNSPGSSAKVAAKTFSVSEATREVRFSDASAIEGVVVTLPVTLLAQGNESALGFSVEFDPANFTFVSASLGSGASGATFNVNSNEVALGKLGIALALPIGKTLAAGSQEVARLSFLPRTSGDLSITFVDAPVASVLSDDLANELAAKFVSGAIVGNPLPSLKITTTDTNTVISWPTWASSFVLQSLGAADLTSTSWTNLTSNVQTNGSEISVTVPKADAQFYRLQHP